MQPSTTPSQPAARSGAGQRLESRWLYESPRLHFVKDDAVRPRLRGAIRVKTVHAESCGLVPVQIGGHGAACGQHADARQAHSGCGRGSLAHHVDDGDAQGALQFVEEAVGRVAGQRQKIAAAGFQKLTVLDKRREGRAVASPPAEMPCDRGWPCR